ncbi:hypothetical protein ACFY8P_32430 [Streptomyces sp. NPDC012693]|uniref:hypothetical protein n=1 Tax=unclassified Streptomyces TaxID=2593676 RepID=UPI002030BC52|nr:hypothetical protein [Streptomyces sp. MSC1_001]
MCPEEQIPPAAVLTTEEASSTLASAETMGVRSPNDPRPVDRHRDAVVEAIMARPSTVSRSPSPRNREPARNGVGPTAAPGQFAWMRRDGTNDKETAHERPTPQAAGASDGDVGNPPVTD